MESDLSWPEMYLTEVNWTELNWTELIWTELNWTELNWTELNAFLLQVEIEKCLEEERRRGQEAVDKAVEVII